jgi:hypothetical protein
LNTLDGVFADLRLHEARQAALLAKVEAKANWIQAERISAELRVTPQQVSDLIESDDQFYQDLCVAVAHLVRDPSNRIQNSLRVCVAFSNAIGREASKGWDERESA